MANVDAQTNAKVETEKDFAQHGCRLAYSSVLAVTTREEAQKLLAYIFTVALMRNPPQGIGGMLFYDEKTHAVVQVLEGPAIAVRELFYEKIKPDTRHTAVKVMWDLDVKMRVFSGFGMQLGNTMAEVLGEGAAANDQQGLLRLTYVSRLTAKAHKAAYDDIQAILGCAVVTNPKLHIGGALFLNIKTLHVQQILEGPQHAVRTLYDKIAKDARHKDCNLLSEEFVTERSYDQWGMLQGNSVEADWSSIKGSWNPKRRRARENLFSEEGAAPAPAAAVPAEGLLGATQSQAVAIDAAA